MSLYRRIVWYFKGIREYTRTGYEVASKSFNEDDLTVDCSGTTFMITGANSGIGKETALEIAKRGGIVHMVCRNPKTSEEARQEIIAATGNENVHLHILDLCDSTQVVRFAKKFVEDYDELNVLINNAGCMKHTRESNASNHEINFATNTLGAYILISRLMALIQKCNKGRVITVSSGGMLLQKLDIDDLELEKQTSSDGKMVYSQNKRQQVIMTEKYAEIIPSVHFSSMHPGWADTPSVRTAIPEFYEKMKDRLRTPQQGADTVVWLAISEAAMKLPSGLFFQDRQVVDSHLPLAWTKSTPADKEKFMSILEDMVKELE